MKVYGNPNTYCSLRTSRCAGTSCALFVASSIFQCRSYCTKDHTLKSMHGETTHGADNPVGTEWNLEIRTQSVPGYGSTFELNFPI
jgi:hypothetical protein